MSKTMLAGALAAWVSLALPLCAAADSGHDYGGKSGDRVAQSEQPTSLSGAWAALAAARDAIKSDVESGALANIHAKAEPLPKLAAALLEQSKDLEAGKLARVEGAVKQVTRVAGALHEAADRGDAARTRKELSRLDDLLELLRAQYPAGSLDASAHEREGHSASGHGHGEHAHAEQPTGVVDVAPRATLRVEALDPFRFQPMRLEVQAGVPTRIELVNKGAVEHSLVVKTPDGSRDWVHLHVLAGATEAATYRLNTPGSYRILCTVPGHTEGGMVGELVVLASNTRSRSHH
jgi:uncharacterized cupredoxin-like copper-binding protein